MAPVPGAGALIGVLSAAGLVRLMSAMLYQVSTLDPRTFLVIPILFRAVAIAACAIPAWRAARVDPMAALRT
jgi:ABC-type antimicrobial peptide transport system permease subunit